MKSCAFFGHRDHDYQDQEAYIRSIIIYLIKNYSVTHFYAGGRGKFDYTCARIVHSLKKEYPQIRLTRVFSYIPLEQEKYNMTYFDDSVYLLERNVPKRYAILETNKALVDKVGFVISGVDHGWGGAAKAVEYAYAHRKAVFEVYAFSNGERRLQTLMHMADRPLTNEEQESRERMLKRVWERIAEQEKEKERKRRKRGKNVKN